LAAPEAGRLLGDAPQGGGRWDCADKGEEGVEAVERKTSSRWREATVLGGHEGEPY